MFENEMAMAVSLLNKDISYDTNYFRECVLICRYLISIGKTDNEIYNTILEKTYNVYENLSDDYKNAEISNIIKVAKAKGILKEIKTINFTKKELDKIHSIGNINTEKLMFIMMCAYKISEDNSFVFQVKDILKEAKISYNNKYYNSLMYQIVGVKKYFYHIVRKNKMKYTPSKEIIEMYDPEDVVLSINNYKNIVYYYLEYIGNGKYIHCESCGCIDLRTSNSKKLCCDCAKDRTKQNKHIYYKNHKLEK